MNYAYYARAEGAVNCLRLRPITELGKTKRDRLACVLTSGDLETILCARDGTDKLL